MFAERFNSLMNIAEVSNSLLGRNIHLSPSYIGRLRSGERPLPKNHEFITSMCKYLVHHINKDYQLNALSHLMNTNFSSELDMNSMAEYIEQWLLETKIDAHDYMSTNRSHYGNEGKRKAVEEFFNSILEEETPQTLLLYSDEDMSWLYEDDRFSELWGGLFRQVIMKGNRVRIIHTIARDINEMMEAINKWLPIYATGMVESYFYPRLRDGIVRRTLFIAPRTAAIVSSSIQNDTSGMLNYFTTDATAIDAFRLEFERYFALCLPLMKLISIKEAASYREEYTIINPDIANIIQAKMPESLQDELDIFVKENEGILMIKKTEPKAAFLISAQNLVSAFWDYYTYGAISKALH